MVRLKSLFTRRRLFLFALVLAVIIGAILLRQRSQGPAAETARVSRQTIEESLTFSGSVDATEKATLRFATTGQIVWVGVKVGDSVKKYQSIASLDSRSLQKTLTKYLATYKKQRNDFEDTADTYEHKILTDSIKRILENSQADLDVTVLDVEIQDLALRLANLWSPIDGIVVKAAVTNPGVIISSPTQAEYEIVNPLTIYFQASADQTELPNLVVGQEGQLVLDTYPEETLTAKIESIDFTPKADETGTVYGLKVSFPTDNTVLKYRLGMTGDFTLVTGRRDSALVLPIKFIKSEADKKYVWRLRNNEKVKVTVTTGLESDNLIEITSGNLAEGDTVAVN